jgi:hypothetical protein
MIKTILATLPVPTVAMVTAGVAHADTIDYGTNQAACKAGAQQANAGGNASAFCFETGPGHYSLSYTRR